MTKAIGFLELSSVAKGIEVADALLKVGRVEMYLASPTCPGKYLALIYGDESAVGSALAAGVELGGEYVIDDLVIPDVAEQLFPAITGTPEVERIEAIGVIESLSLASLMVAANAAVKAAAVRIVELRAGSGIGGKSFVTLTGTPADVETAIASGVAAIRETGNIVYFTVIDTPHEDFKRLLL